jgi:phospholipid transport system substrate-binding protein
LARHEELEILHYRRMNLMVAVALVCATILLMMNLVARAASSAEAVVSGAIDSMKALPAAQGHPDTRRRLLDSIDNALALDLLAKQALGAQWDKLSDAERHHFVAVFTQSLEKIGFPRAAAALSQVKVNYLGEDLEGSTQVVRTTIGREDGGKVPFDFMLVRRGSRWQIFDVMMDGESLPKAVSKRFQVVMQREGYLKLVEELQKQIAEADAGN